MRVSKHQGCRLEKCFAEDLCQVRSDLLFLTIYKRRLVMKCLMKYLAALSLVLAVNATCGALSVSAAPKVNLVLGGIQPADDISTLAIQHYAKLVAERSGGALTIQVHPASQLGDATTQVEAVSMGAQDMMFDSGSWVATFVPAKNVETMFFLFRDEDHYMKYLDSDIMKDFEQSFLKQQNIRILANKFARLPRSTVSTKPIRTMADFSGVKERVPDIRGYLESVAAMGASPVQVAWGETYLALQQGVVGACESPLDMIYSSKFYEAGKYVTMTEHQRDNMVIMINENKFKSLTPDQQKILVDAGKEAADWYRGQIAERVKKFVELMKAAGTEFIEIDVTPLRTAVRARAIEMEKGGAWPVGLFDKIANYGK
jgi:tripartite ATP-independent transporter DctP family solute receptor